MTPWIEEAALAVRAPGRGVVAHRVVVVGSCLGSTTDGNVGIVNEHLDPRRSAAERRWALPAVVRGLRDEERRPVELQSNNRSQVPQLSGTKGFLVPSRGCCGVRHREHDGDESHR